jgi:CheY-like chemotaxis protein
VTTGSAEAKRGLPDACEAADDSVFGPSGIGVISCRMVREPVRAEVPSGGLPPTAHISIPDARLDARVACGWVGGDSATRRLLIHDGRSMRLVVRDRGIGTGPDAMPPGGPVEGTEAAPTGQRAVTGGTRRILLVEDEAAVRDIVARTLRRQGHLVDAFSEGREALEHWRQRADDYDLVLTDVVMPGMGGWELGQRLRETRPGVRVIYMSGYSDEIIARHGITTPADIILLQKPFAPNDLLAALAHALDRP